jgi:hypothetical protein
MGSRQNPISRLKAARRGVFRNYTVVLALYPWVGGFGAESSTGKAVSDKKKLKPSHEPLAEPAALTRRSADRP